jgi:hypothetical protein
MDPGYCFLALLETEFRDDDGVGMTMVFCVQAFSSFGREGRIP